MSQWLEQCPATGEKETGEVLNIEFNTSPQGFGRDAAFHYFVGFGHESKLSHLSAFLVVELKGHVSNSPHWETIC